MVVTAYNRREFVVDAIKSVLNQKIDRSYYEIILIKNFIDDSIDAFCSKNGIKVIIMEGSIGEFYRKGVEESKGEVISFLDDDDIFVPDKISEVIHVFRNIPTVGLHYNRSIMCDHKQFDSKLSEIQMKNAHVSDEVHTIKKDGLSFLIKNGLEGNNSSMSIRRNIILSQLQKLSNIYVNEDFFIYSLAPIFGFDILISPRILTIRGMGNYNTTNIKYNTGNCFCTRAVKRTELLINTFSILKAMVEESRIDKDNGEIFFVIQARFNRIRMMNNVIHSEITRLDHLFATIRTGFKVLGIKYIIGTTYVFVVEIIRKTKVISKCQAIKLIKFSL